MRQQRRLRLLSPASQDESESDRHRCAFLVVSEAKLHRQDRTSPSRRLRHSVMDLCEWMHASRCLSHGTAERCRVHTRVLIVGWNCLMFLINKITRAWFLCDACVFSCATHISNTTNEHLTLSLLRTTNIRGTLDTAMHHHCTTKRASEFTRTKKCRLRQTLSAQFVSSTRV